MGVGVTFGELVWAYFRQFCQCGIDGFVRSCASIRVVGGKNRLIITDAEQFRIGKRIMHIQGVSRHLFHEEFMGETGKLFFVFAIQE